MISCALPANMPSCPRNSSAASSSAAHRGQIPTLYQGNVAYVNLLKELGLEHIWFEQKGMHEWAVWDEAVREMLNTYDQVRKYHV